MKNKTAKQIVNNYKYASAGVILLNIIGIIVGLFLLKFNALIGIALIVVLLMTAKSTLKAIREKTVESVLYEDLDAEKFNEIVSSGVFGKSTHHKLLAAMYSGDHDTVLSLTEQEMKNEINPVKLCNSLYKRGYVYFEREDMDSLKEVVREFYKLKKQHAKYGAIFENYSVFEKYDAFLDGDYQFIVEICDYDLKNDSKKSQNHNLTILNVSYYRAVALYKLEQYDEAKNAFEKIIKYAPKAYKAKLSQDYLSKIEANS